MKMKKILGLIILMSVVFSTPVVFACVGEGYSPGYWKSRCRRALRGRTIEWDLEELIDDMPFPYNTWTIEGFVIYFRGNNRDGHKTFAANLFNAAADLSPYED